MRYGLVALPGKNEEVVTAGVGKSGDVKQPRRSDRRMLDVSAQLAGILGPRFVVLREIVWKDLKLAEIQRDKLAKIRQTELEAMMKLMRELQEDKPQQRGQRLGQHRRQAAKRLKEQLQGVLTEPQQQRLRQIELQHQGLFSLSDPSVQKKMSLTQQQRKKYAGIVQQMQRTIQSIQQKARDGGDPRQIQQQAMQVRKEQEKKIGELLSQSQLKTWKQLLGTPLAKDSIENE